MTATFAFDERAEDAISALISVLQSRRWSANTFADAFDASVNAISVLVPHFPDVDEQLVRTRAIVGELKTCPPGDAEWRRYEAICLKALRMLFVPPFNNVSFVQRYTHRRDERRDAVLSNTVHEGFWNTVRAELDCRHVICEFKNVNRLSKRDLTQLRVYLRKPTVGRLGFIFHRAPAGASARLARHIAYADDRAVILLIDDVTLVRLLLTRVFLGSADYALQELKAEFELRY